MCGGVSIDSVLFVLHTLLNYSLSLWTSTTPITLSVGERKVVVCLQDVKMKRLAARHVTSTTSVHSRQAVHRQLRQWDNNLNRLRLSHFRYACYVSALHNVELPNSLVANFHLVIRPSCSVCTTFHTCLA